MLAVAVPRPLPSTARPLLVGRLGLRATRRALREARDPHRWWTVTPRAEDDLELRPASLADAGGWARLVAQAADRPLPAGVAASPLGGAPGASRPGPWRQACLDLRAAARRGQAFPYLAYIADELVGEVLAFPDRGSSGVEIVCWLHPPARTPQRVAGCIDLLAQHVFAGPHPPARALCYVAAADADALCAASRLGLRREGSVADPPGPDRVLLVAGRPGSGRTFD